MKMQSFSVQNSTNFWLMAIISLINLCALFVIPIYLLPLNTAWGLLLIPIVLLTNTYWSLIHEAIHNIFHSNRNLNDYGGRLMAILFGTSFHLAQYGHLMHHAFNRTDQDVDRTEVFEKNKDHIFPFTVKYYFELLGGLFLAEFFVPLLTWMPLFWLKALLHKVFAKQPQMLKIMDKRLLTSNIVNAMRIDGVIIYALYIVSFYCYGQHWWMLLLLLLVRGFMISFANNLPHYGTPVDDVRYALNLKMPNVFAKFILNFNLHRTHHLFPNVPWHALPQALNDSQDHCDINYFKQGLSQFKGPIAIEKLRGNP